MLKNSRFSISQSLYFSLIFDGYFCWTYKSGLDSFSFQCFKNIPLTSVSDEKSLIIYTILPLYVMDCFSVTVLRFYSLTLVLSSVIMICLVMVSFNIFSALFSPGTLLTCIFLHDIVLQVTKVLLIFFQSFFSFSLFFLYYHIISSLTLSSAVFSLLLSSFRECLISVLYFLFL